MAGEPANGNGIPNRILAWAIALVAAGAALFFPLKERQDSHEAHTREILALRDQVHAANIRALEARISGQDAVLQREMRLLDDAQRERLEGLERAYTELHGFILGRVRLEADSVKGE